jgi:hypothetical protein
MGLGLRRAPSRPTWSAKSTTSRRLENKEVEEAGRSRIRIMKGHIKGRILDENY